MKWYLATENLTNVIDPLNKDLVNSKMKVRKFTKTRKIDKPDGKKQYMY